LKKAHFSHQNTLSGEDLGNNTTQGVSDKERQMIEEHQHKEQLL
jgi:hypothetical protein